MVAHPSTRLDVDAGIPDLFRRLTDDSKRLAIDEVRLAKMELRESVSNGVRGSVWLAVSLAIGVVALVALTPDASKPEFPGTGGIKSDSAVQTAVPVASGCGYGYGVYHALVQVFVAVHLSRTPSLPACVESHSPWSVDQ